MQTIGVNNAVGGALLYVNDETTELYATRLVDCPPQDIGRFCNG